MQASIQIHLMLLLIVFYLFSSLIYLNSNTSHVTINLTSSEQMQIFNAYSNTSHVTINQAFEVLNHL